MIRLFVLALVLLTITSCATPYQQVGTSVAGGFSTKRLSTESFEVRFSANGFTNPKRAYDLAFLHAAEVALEHNYPYFILIGQQDDTSTEMIKGNSTSYTTGSVSPYGSFSGTTNTTTTNIPVTKPDIALRIFCFESRDALGEHAGVVYVAEDVKRELREKYKLDKP